MTIDFDKFDKNSSNARMLDAYLESNQVEYAILVTGIWGSGKTYFINEFIKEKKRSLEEKNKFLGEIRISYAKIRFQDNEEKDIRAFCYVSLFDVRSYEDLDKMILSQLTSFSNCDKSNNLGRFTSYLFDKMIDSHVPSDYSNLLKKGKDKVFSFLHDIVKEIPEKMIIVLDDLERSSLESKDVLGYVNNLLVNYKAKVILIADEEMLSLENRSQHLKNTGKKQQNNTEKTSTQCMEQKLNSFKKIKEKIIGKTIKVQASKNIILDNYINSMDNVFIQDIFKDNYCKIFDCLNEYKLENLRTVKWFLSETELFFKVWENFSKRDEYDNKAFAEKLIESMLFLSNLIHNNIKTSEEIRTFAYIFDLDNKLSTFEKDIQNKLNNILYNLNIQFLWARYFEGEFLYNDIVLVIADNYHNSLMDIRIDIYGLSKEEFKLQHEILYKKVESNCYTESSDILTFFIQELQFSQMGLVSTTEDEVISKFTQYIQNIDITLAKKSSMDFGKYSFHDSLQWREYNPNEKFLVDSMTEVMDKKYSDLYTKIGINLIASLGNYKEFSGKIKDIIEHQPEFNFSYISANELLETLISVSNKNKILRELKSLSESYYFWHLNKDETLQWWENLYKAFEKSQLDNHDKVILSDLFKHIKIREHIFSWQKVS